MIDRPLFVSGYACIGAQGAAPEKPDLALLAPTLRRGLSDVTRLFMHVAKEALAQAQLQADQVQLVFASAFGEIHAAEQLMAQAYDENSSSPARFRHSVHNTAAGLFSISARSHLPGTALAAGWDTLAMGLLEASAQLDQGAQQVLLVCAEERVPAAFDASYSYAPLAAAFALSAAPGSRSLARIAHLRRQQLAAPPSTAADLNHPLAPCVGLCRALQERAHVTLAVGEQPEPWCVDVDAREAA
jgi:hypothetical protein